MSTHARFSPSKLPRIIKCPGSAQLTKDMEQDSSSYADEGTMLHDVVERYLRAGKFKVTGPLHADPKMHIEYKDAVEACLHWVFTLKVNSQDGIEQVETKTSLAKFASAYNCPELEDVAGTLDYSYEMPGVLYITDWKFGKGVPVSPDSDQLKAYALGALQSAGRASQFTKVVCTIVQPRIGDGGPSQVEYTPQELLRWLKHTLVPALQATNSETPILNPSEDGCRWCAIKMNCKARHSLALETAQNVFACHAKIPNSVDYEELKGVLDMIPILDQYIKDIANFAFNTITSCGQVPGYKVVAGRAIRKWKNEEKTKELLEERGYDTSEFSEIKFWGPAKVEKAVSREDKALLLPLIIKPEGKPTLTVESDKRPALTFKNASQIFEEYTNENSN